VIKVIQKNDDLFVAEHELNGSEHILILRNMNNLIFHSPSIGKTYVMEIDKLSVHAINKSLTAIFSQGMFITYNAKETIKWLMKVFNMYPIDWRCIFINSQIVKKGIKLSEDSEYPWYIPTPLTYQEAHDAMMAMADVYITQMGDIEKESLGHVVMLESGAIPAFAQMEQFGAPVDVAELGRMYRDLFTLVPELNDSVQSLLPGEPINLESPKELLEKFMSMKIKIKKPDGQTIAIPDTSKDSLLQMVGHAELRDGLSAYRTAVDTMEKVTQIKNSVKNKHVFATFNQIMAATGRTSTKNPNLAGLPKSIRHLIAAPKGQRIITADYRQCELKIIAHISQDKTMLKAFKENVDIHVATAKEIWGQNISVTDALRSKAKAVNFGLAYGLGDESLAIKLGCSVTEAREVMRAHEAKFPSVYTCLKKYGEIAVKTKTATTLLGRVRKLEDKTSQGALHRAGANMVIQGTAADMMKMALWHLVKNGYKKLPFYIWNSVYDEVSVVSSDRHRDVMSIIQASMNHAMSEIIPSVPPGVDISINDCWD
jgi:DNA polymerase-1